MRFFRSPSTDAAFNLALEELLFLDGASDSFMLWRNAPSVILGRHQNAAAEIDSGFVREHAIKVVRRITGGGAVYHDLGNINFTRTGPAGPWSPEAAARTLAPVLAGLRRLGFACTVSGRNDILCGGVKISGCARTVRKNRMLFHGTLLYDADLSILGRALTPDPEKLRSKGVASVRARVGDLRAMAGADAPDTDIFLARLEAALAAELGLSGAEAPDAGLLAQAEELAESKYRTRAWNWGAPFPCDLIRRRRFAGGTVAAELRIADDRITAVRFTGDFFADRPVEELENGLAGVVPEHHAVLAKLRELDAGTYISGVAPEDLAGLIAP